jgi:hypothetical protein
MAPSIARQKQPHKGARPKRPARMLARAHVPAAVRTMAHLILPIAAAQLGDLAAAREHLAAVDEGWPEELRQHEFRVINDT